MVRRRVNDGLPKYCQRRKWGVIYQPYLGRENGKTKWGEAINLGPGDMTVPQVWAAYERRPRTVKPFKIDPQELERKLKLPSDERWLITDKQFHQMLDDQILAEKYQLYLWKRSQGVRELVALMEFQERAHNVEHPSEYEAIGF